MGAPPSLARRVLGEGVLIGLTGAAIMAAYFLFFDIAAGTPFRTPAVLGSAVFGRLRNPDAVVVSTPIVLAYTLLHVAAFVAVGLALAGLFALAERDRRTLALLMLLGGCAVVVYGAIIAIMQGWLGESMAPWVVFTGGALAAAGMLAVVLAKHRRVFATARGAMDS
jgi:hypothetical protein